MTVKNFVESKIATLDRDEPYSKAACAKLRRAIGKPRSETPDIWDITLLGAPEDEKSGRAIHTSLTLYALHCQGKDESMNDSETGFGTAIAQLVSSNMDNEASIRRRFNAVATSMEFTELAHHARGLVQLLKSNDIKMDYPGFARDLFCFQFPEHIDSIRLKWGMQFYRTNNSERIDENEIIYGHTCDSNRAAKLPKQGRNR